MINTEWYTIRALTLPATAVALLYTFLIVWLILRLQFSKKYAEIYADAVFTFMIVWKFSLFFTDFKAVIAQPISLLYFNGGTIGVFLGVLAALWQVWRKKAVVVDLKAYCWAMVLTQSIYQWFAVLLNNNSVIGEVMTLVVLSLLTIFILWKLTALKQSLLLYTAGFILVAFFQPLGIWQTAVGVSLLLLCMGIVIHHNENNAGGKA